MIYFFCGTRKILFLFEIRKILCCTHFIFLKWQVNAFKLRLITNALDILLNQQNLNSFVSN